MRIDDHSMRGWAIPIIVSAVTVAVLEGVSRLHAGFGIAVGLTVATLAGIALVISSRRKD
jgi:hypothetical protein